MREAKGLRVSLLAVQRFARFTWPRHRSLNQRCATMAAAGTGLLALTFLLGRLRFAARVRGI